MSPWISIPGAGVLVLGTLNLNGTDGEGNEVVLTRESQSSENWLSIVFGGSGAGSFEHAMIAFGGMTLFGLNGNIVLRNSSMLTIMNSAIEDSANIGIALADSASVVSSNPVTTGGNTFARNTTDVSDLRL
ncbi:MAG: hypothetical protein AAF735_03030 [Myxococcota bacterium]